LLLDRQRAAITIKVSIVNFNSHVRNKKKRSKKGGGGELIVKLVVYKKNRSKLLKSYIYFKRLLQKKKVNLSVRIGFYTKQKKKSMHIN